ncbi:DedA family protein [Streptomyces sp. SBT349]|uniref:DedA family protein n=1 Tax=Streptomyces sp. SBT349 TaxID=1580539 RepID=UPI000AE80307|nr:VTT domain-containing protein [Streptomyces sp. SBT349]
MTTAAACADRALVVSLALDPESTQHAIGYPTLFLLVLLGSLVPVVPTGALVSTSAAVAVHHHSPVLASLIVFVVATTAAYLGDALLYWLGLRGTRARGASRWLDRMRRHVAPDRLARAERNLERHGTAVLVISRQVPAGRLPTMLACLLAPMPLRDYLRGNVPAVLCWAATYQLLGTLGGALFPHPWQGVVAAVVLTALIAAVPTVWSHVRRTRARARTPERPTPERPAPESNQG